MQSEVWDSDELASIKNVDRMLPSQPYFSKMYRGNDFYGDLEKLLFSVNGGKEEFDIRLKPGMTYEVMGTEVNTLRYYQFLIRQNGYKNALEIGTYIGVSAMYMADAVGKDGHVTTLEKGGEFYNIARGNIERNGFMPVTFNPWIRQINMDALEFLMGDKEKYDFILIDGAKEIYHELLELSLNRLSPGGMVLVDDVFFQGETLNDVPTSKKGNGVRKMIAYVKDLKGYEKIIMPIGNGLLMVRKISS